MATFSDVLRRLYSDLITRRSRVRVAQATEPSLACDPVFVIGIYRSGTTLLRYVLDSHSSLACPPESAFLAHLDRMANDERSRAGFESLGFDDDHVMSRMRAFAAYFFEGYAGSHGKPRWVDKSPNYVDHLEFIESIFPTSKMLMIYRHPLDQVDSAAKRGTIRYNELAPYVGEKEDEDSRIIHCRYWAAKAANMLAFEESDFPTHRLRYEDMCTDPEGVFRPIFDFLDEPWEDSVLEFYDSDHDKGNEDGRASATRGFVVSKSNYNSWPEDLKTQCWEIVEPVASRLGYEL
ncbi:MAG: sulfotransferase [Verrucomicrobiales bacterium]|nr:sulfotransferase [Verrucomicrobiales bacterium]